MRPTALLIALALLPVLPAVPAAAAETARVAGDDRIGTAVAISERGFPEGAATVYLARADVLSDALAAGSLTDGPVLLVPPCGEIPDNVVQEAQRLDVAEVVALGGEHAVCEATLSALGDGAVTSRLAGDGRIETAAAIARRSFPESAATVYLANAADSPDAVAGGSLTDGPVLLVSASGSPDPAVVETIAALDPAEVVALGGTAVVGDDALQAAAAGRPVGRLAGDSRFDAAAAVAGRSFPATSDVVYLARADVFADAVAAGTLTDGPVLLVPSCGEPPAAVTDAIARLAPATVVALGGTAAVCDELLAGAAGQPPPGPAEYCVDDPAGDVDDPRGDIIRFCLTYGDTVRASLQVAEPVDPFSDAGWVNGRTGLLVLIDPESGREGVEDFAVGLGHGDDGLVAYAYDPFTGDTTCVGTPGFDGSLYIVGGFGRACVGSPERFLFGVEFGYEDAPYDLTRRSIDRLGSFPPSIPFPPSDEPPPQGPPVGQPTADDIVLAPSGLGVAAFGQPATEVVAALTAILGPPTDDEIGDCFGPLNTRFITWGDLTTYFGPDTSTFANWTYRGSEGIPPTVPGIDGLLSTPEGATFGSTVAELRGWYGDRLRIYDDDPELFGYGWSVEGTELSGALTGNTDADTVISIIGSYYCLE